MAGFVLYNGKPGSTWSNHTGRVAYQLIVSWANSCGVCCQYDHAISGGWPIPFHYGCRCHQIPIFPESDSQEFVDYREKIADLPESQKREVVGTSNYRLIERGVVQWSDVVTEGRVRDLREVVSIRSLNLKTLTKAGVRQDIATEAVQSVSTADHTLADEARRRLTERLKAKGVQVTTARQMVAERLAARVSITGPSGPSTPRVKFTPPPPSKPLTPQQIEAVLGVQLKIPEIAFGVAFVKSLRAKDQRMPTVTVDVAKVDEAWQRDHPDYYVPRGGQPDAVGQAKYEQVRQFVERAIAEGIPVEQSQIVVDRDGSVSFIDGRHRFAVLRDLGAVAIPVSVDRSSVARARKTLTHGPG